MPLTVSHLLEELHKEAKAKISSIVTVYILPYPNSQVCQNFIVDRFDPHTRSRQHIDLKLASMRFSEIGRWQAAIGMVALLPMCKIASMSNTRSESDYLANLVISASPLQSVKRDNDEYHECMTPDSKRWYVYNKNGKPSPRDLQVATNPDCEFNVKRNLIVEVLVAYTFMVPP